MNLPRVIGRYEVLRLLGQGGMGRVLLATDTVLGRRVAIKILRDDLGIPPEVKQSLFSRMRQEARAAATIAHPHLVTLHDMGEEPEVGLYLVFEYIEGPTLREQITLGALAPRDVAIIARDLGKALAVAHEAGVIHRDVKPENVLLSEYGAKLTDFGIARIPDSTLTLSGTALGTPAYSAPEALMSGKFGPLSDQFSLAATLYEALTGRRAFQGADAAEVAANVAHAIPRPVASILGAPALLGRADAVIERAMSKIPERRWESCAEFGYALADAIDVPMPAVVMTPTPMQSIIPRETRRKHNAAAGVALLVIVGLAVWGKSHAPTDDAAPFRSASSTFANVTTPPRAPATSTNSVPKRPKAAPASSIIAPPISSSLSNAMTTAIEGAEVTSDAEKETAAPAAKGEPPTKPSPAPSAGAREPLGH